MKLLMLSTDENIFKEGSKARSRILEYGKLVEEMHIVVLTARNFQTNTKFQISKNIWAYPTNSLFKLFRIFSAYKIGKKIITQLLNDSITQLLITTQDPFETGLVGYFLKKKFRIPLQIQIHTDFLSPYFWQESFKNKIRVMLAKRIILHADGIRAVSERIKNSLLSLYPKPYTLNPISVLPIFIDIEGIKNSPIKTDLHKKYPGKFIILIASRLTREKNIGLAIESAKNLIPNYPNILLLIVGSGPEKDNLQLLITNYQLQNNVVIEDWSDDLPSYYKTADLFLLTSNYEGYGRTVIEAAAVGLPVVMTDVGVAIGSIVLVDDVKKLTECLSVLIGDALEREKILENQEGILRDMPSKEEYLDLMKQSWINCFS